MSFLPDELKTQMFPCPSCGHYVNDEIYVCKHCGVNLTDEMRSEAISKENAERKKSFLGAEKQILATGIAILGFGVFNLIFQFIDFGLNYSSGVRIPCFSLIAIVLGIAISLHGLRGYLRERRK
jgi:hypothetical protein